MTAALRERETSDLDPVDRHCAVLCMGCSEEEFDKLVQEGDLPVAGYFEDGDPYWMMEDIEALFDIEPIEAADGFVYIISFAQFVKIGWSGDLVKRLQALQQSAPARLTLHSSFPGTKKHERDLHQRFSHLRTRGEWFKREAELAAWIKEGCPQ